MIAKFPRSSPRLPPCLPWRQPGKSQVSVAGSERSTDRAGRAVASVALLTLVAAASVGAWGTWHFQNAARLAQRQFNKEQVAHLESRRQHDLNQRKLERAGQHIDQSAQQNSRLQARLKASEAQRLAALSRTVQVARPETAVLLAAEAAFGDASAYVIQTLLEQLNQFGGKSLPGHTTAVTAAAISPDGTRAVTADRTGKLAVWQLDPNLKSVLLGQPLWLEGHEAQVDQLLFTADGRYVISASADTNLRVWDLESIDPAQFVVTLRGHHDAVTSIAIAGDGRVLLSGGRDGEVRLWRWSEPEAARSSQVVLKSPTGIVSLGIIGATAESEVALAIDREGNLHSLPALMPDRLSSATAEVDSSSALAVRERLRSELQNLPDQTVTSWAYSDDRQQLALGFDDGRVHVLLANTEPPMLHVFASGSGPVSRLCWSGSGSGEQLATVNMADGLQLWHIPTAGRPDLRRVQLLAESVVPGARLEFCDRGQRLALISGEQGVRLWLRDPAGLFQRPQTLAVSAGDPTVSQSIAGSDVLLVGDERGTVRYWQFDQSSASALPRLISNAANTGIRRLDLIGDEVVQDGMLLAWEMAGDVHQIPRMLSEPDGEDDGILVSTRPESKPATTAVLAVSPDARWLVRQCRDGTLELAPTEVPSLARRIEIPDVAVVQTAAVPEIIEFASDGHWLALGFADGDVWVVRNEPEVAGPLKPFRLGKHADAVRVMAFDDESRWLAVTGWLPTVSVWPLHTDEPAAERRLTGHVGQVTAIGFRAGTSELWTGGVDASLRRWDLAKPSGSELIEILRDPTGGISGLEQLPWLSAVVSHDRSGQLRLWTAVTEAAVKDTADTGGADTSAYGSAAARSRAPASDVRFASTVIQGSHGVPTVLVVAPEQSQLLAAFPDQSVRMWTLRRGEAVTKPLILPNHGEEVTALKLAADGRTVYCGTRSGRIVGWPLDAATLASQARKVVGRELTSAERLEFAVPDWSAIATAGEAAVGESAVGGAAVRDATQGD